MGALLLAAAAPPSSRAGKTQTRPYPLALEVVWGDPVGPEMWREDLERTLADEIGGRGCFTSVEHHDPDRVPVRPLVLRVAIVDYLERSTYGVGISALEAPDVAPETRQSQVAEISALFDLRLISLPEGAEVRSRRFADRVTYRPVMNEDPRYESRSRMLESVRKTVASFVCKGSSEKFEKELAQARGEAGARGDESR